MRSFPFFLALLASAAGLDAARAIDVNPSKNVQPDSFYEGPGNRFSIFNGDPKRIQRANAVDAKSFDTKVEVSPSPISIGALKAASPNPAIKITFSVHNHSKKTYTLSFSSAQRWDYRIIDSTGAPVYVYSDNCEFEQKVGTSMVNNDDRLVYTDTVTFQDLLRSLEPGIYKVQTVMANYPEMHAETTLTVQP